MSASDDPLLAALPPATDYITYLTLLEYQLTPHNLSTLNRLLSQDDGTLAAEIGWDLLKLVLPMLRIVPDDARECLHIISRRGNPRELIVRVAEEFERLASQVDSIQSDSEPSEDELPTFPGEATRIHLGQLSLGSIPAQAAQVSIDPTTAGVRSQQLGSEEAGEQVIQTLLSMLGTLHPRIATKYPSRFLATSLPAALRAYRSTKASKATTLAFVALLGKLSGRQRPALPPRASQSRIETSPAADRATTISLPDAEADLELSHHDITTQTSADEKSISKKLLQAVSLEVLEEYMRVLNLSEDSHMFWTSRLRESQEPKRVVPGKITQHQRWSNHEDLASRDEVVKAILQLAKHLDLDASGLSDVECTAHVAAEGDESPDPDSEYPTSPASIPLSRSGLVHLYAASQFYHFTDPKASTVDINSLDRALRLFLEDNSADHDGCPALTDASLSLMYIALCHHTDTVMSPSQPSISAALLKLQDIFVTSIDPTIRDDAHHVAGRFLRNLANPSTKIQYITQILFVGQHASQPVYQVQAGNLRAIGITWLKDLLLTNNLDVSLLIDNPTIQSLIFDVPPLTTHPSTLSQPQPPPSPSLPIIKEEKFDHFLLHIPSYIATSNLICILAKLTNPTNIPLDSIHNCATQFLTTLRPWQTLLSQIISQRGSDDVGLSADIESLSTADVYALEDACHRASDALAAMKGQGVTG